MLLPVTLSFLNDASICLGVLIATSIFLTGTSHCWLEAMCSNTEPRRLPVECSWPV